MDPDPHELPARKRIALVAHDNEKATLLAWCREHRDVLAHHELLATGTTGALIEEALGLAVQRFRSGPLGGDQQIGSRIVEGTIDVLLFFWDPLDAHPHEPDVRALLRIAVLSNLPIACNRSTADFLVSSPHFGASYRRVGTPGVAA